ncbi:conserved hypothetical protein [Streptomyces scabiei 87.22]|uniref:Uncharacterized protein n=1 Tax=Streptomyces scabiei (strain 87.22) TaxID=680198 RepID=C9ZDE3_STRSW|nr:conserved hypothetical protein [Streptomyces scabiei 87.22]
MSTIPVGGRHVREVRLGGLGQDQTGVRQAGPDSQIRWQRRVQRGVMGPDTGEGRAAAKGDRANVDRKRLQFGSQTGVGLALTRVWAPGRGVGQPPHEGVYGNARERAGAGHADLRGADVTSSVSDRDARVPVSGRHGF